MNEFVSWCRHLLVSFLFHAVTSLHPLTSPFIFIEMIFPLVTMKITINKVQTLGACEGSVECEM